jgi:prepilin peptidase CpaA
LQLSALAPWGLAYFCAVLALAAASDVRRYLIPNWMPLALAAGAVVLAFPASGDVAMSRGLSFLIMAVVTIGLWLVRGLGGGDVKLLIAAALWIPLGQLTVFVLAVAVAGGVQAAVTLVLRKVRPPVETPSGRQRMPYAVAIAVGGFYWAWLSYTQR